MKSVYTLLSGRKLDERAFLGYLSDKIKKTKKKFNVERKDAYCLDDAAIDIVYGLMNRKRIRTKKSQFLYCLKKELELYGRLRKKKFNFIEYRGLKLKVKEMLDELEKQHPEIKYSILRAQEKL
jgi:hypothetical protein